MSLRRPATNLQVRKWLTLAAIDVAIVSIAQPLNFAVGVLWADSDWRFWPCFSLVVVLNIVTIALSWWVSMQIMFKREE